MNTGNAITQALLRNQLPVNDYATRAMALDMWNEILQEHWNAKKYTFRKSAFYLTTADGVEEYAFSKYVDQIVKNSMRGSDPVRRLKYEPSSDFFQKRPFTLEDANPYIYRDGEYYGVARQPSAASTIAFVSSLDNYTTGTITAVKGSTKVIIATGAFTLDMLGRWLKVGSDTKKYKLVTFESATVMYLNEPYEGTSASGLALIIGDIQQKAVVKGFLANGSITEEEVQLNGSTSVSTSQSFASLISISKSDKTYGYVSATSNSGVIAIGTLDPGETETYYKTIKLYPIPTKAEVINYEGYSIHPVMVKNVDSPLFPAKWHPFLLLDLIIKIRSEFLHSEPMQEMVDRREQLFDQLLTRENDVSDWDKQQESEDLSNYPEGTNLPTNFGADSYD